MKCPKCGSIELEWSSVANGIAVCKNCRYQGVPNLGTKTNFDWITKSPEVLAEGSVCNRNGMWEFVWHNIAIIRMETREAAVAMAIEYLKKEVN